MSTFDFSSFTRKRYSYLSPNNRPSKLSFQERFSKFKKKLHSNNYIKEPVLSIPMPNRKASELTRRLRKENSWLRDVITKKNIKTDSAMPSKASPKSSLNDSMNQIYDLFDKLEQDLNNITL